MIASDLLRKPETGHVAPLSGPKELLEYEKILNIRDQIFSGHHPRLKVPQHVIRNFTPRSVQSPSIPSTPSGPHETTVSIHSKENHFSSNSHKSSAANDSPVEVTTMPGSSAPYPSNIVPATATVKPASEIDPIFLTKSDDLIRAEIQLQRQRIERTLRDQVEQKRINSKRKPLPQELNPDFDVAEIFAKIMENVKPISQINTQKANGNVAASDSFDENSFYSSKAPDSPPTEPAAVSPHTGRQPQPMLIDDADADTDLARQVEGNRFLDDRARNLVYSESHPSSFEEITEKTTTATTTDIPLVLPDLLEPREERQSFDEPEYSPPGPNLVSSRRESGSNIPVSDRTNTAPTHHRASRPEQEPQHQQYPTPDVRVVRNHITSPAAPQPSRVSPLAVSKAPGLTRQNRRQRRAERRLAAQPAGRTSPEGPIQPLVSRKRRREQEKEERRPAVSPEPYIKPEPVSPPPFIEVAAPAYVRPRIPQPGSNYVEIDSPQYTALADRRESGAGRTGYYDVPTYDTEVPANINISRSASRLAYKRPVMDERDLRRVATMQHARQSEIVRDYHEPAVSPRYLRAASYAVTDRPIQAEKPRYYDEIAPYPKSFATGVRPASPRIHDEYIEALSDSRSMGPPPPQRRIVIDADGNRYYEAVAPSPSSRMVPASTRLAHAEPYDEGPAVRTAPSRAVSVLENPYPGRRYVQEMPPPPITYRRIPEYPRIAPGDHAMYDRELDERTRVPRGSSVQLIDYPHRQPTYVEEPVYPREELVRMSSVRPSATRFEDPVEPPMRMQSVRPVRREVSVYIEDEPHTSREYPPVDRVSYPVARERYFDSDDTSRLGVENTQGMIRRVSRRY
ncbi:hypothetical protein LOZ65_000027 [Ophidiomyces ophidiicola]|nr:hypothetical protein LOZ65_000027 [Ophidiomyces ophidiicola]